MVQADPMPTQLPRRRVLAGLGALAGLAGVSARPAPSQAQDGVWNWAEPRAIVERLRRGGLVVFLRHADTSGMPADKTFDVDDRDGQQNLSEAGRRQAAAIGNAFKRLSIPVGEVRASPVLRARDTAEIAFGIDRVKVEPDLIAREYENERPAEDLVRSLRRMLSTRPPKDNLILVGHLAQLGQAIRLPLTDAQFPEGSAAVFRPMGGDGFLHVGTLVAGWEKF